MSKRYNAADIEVLSGLDPVRRRPGMYTDTTRPNHLAHEVVDNSVDEALENHCKKIEVTLFDDGSLEVIDDGRGMPVDIHPKEKIPGVELILTRLHAGGKFNKDNYQYSGGLHGVGVSVVNALSKNLEVWIRRGGKEYNLSFAGGKKKGKLEVVGKVGKANTGTTIRFWPDPQYFDSAKISVSSLKHALRAKAVLCPGLSVKLTVEKPQEIIEWCYAGGLEEYLLDSIGKAECLPADPFAGSIAGNHEAVDWALVWQTGDAQTVAESYVNLVPTTQGGTHVNGLRTGLTNALRGVELILTRLHAGGKFNKDNYQYSGGLHGVGVSVVNALSKNLEVWIRRGGKEYNLSFAGGKKKGKLEVVGKVGKANTGTTIRFWPDPQYFDSAKISVSSLKHALRAKAVLCPGLSVKLTVEKPQEIIEWCYAGGLEEYLLDSIGSAITCPAILAKWYWH